MDRPQLDALFACKVNNEIMHCQRQPLLSIEIGGKNRPHIPKKYPLTSNRISIPMSFPKKKIRFY